MPGEDRRTYGDAPKKRVKLFVAALLAYANEDLAGVLHTSLIGKLELENRDRNWLVVKASTGVLIELAGRYETKDKYEQSVNKDRTIHHGVHINDVIFHLRNTLAILEDHRHKRNKAPHFTLKLWHSYKEKKNNLDEVEKRWPKKSKIPIASTSPAILSPQPSSSPHPGSLALEQQEYAARHGEIKPNNIHLTAVLALLGIMDSSQSEAQLSVRNIYTSEELQDLWEIDDSAYGEASIPLPVFHSWWEAYDSGLKVLFYGDQIVGAFGIWPLSEDCACKFQNGEVKEADLDPGSFLASQALPSHNWYVSGIVLREDIRKSKKANPIQLLLSSGISLWIESDHVAYPVKVMALASSQEGEKILQRSSFIRVREASMMADAHHLYVLRACSKQDFLSILRKRRLC